MLKIINRLIFRYLGHTIRNRKCHVMNLVVRGKIEGKRKKGHLQISYMHTFRVMGLPYEVIFQTVEDGEK